MVGCVVDQQADIVVASLVGVVVIQLERCQSMRNATGP